MLVKRTTMKIIRILSNLRNKLMSGSSRKEYLEKIHNAFSFQINLAAPKKTLIIFRNIN